MYGGNRFVTVTETSVDSAFLVNQWLSVRFDLISCCIIAIVGLVAVASPAVNASLAGFALAFASSFTMDVSLKYAIISLLVNYLWCS